MATIWYEIRNSGKELLSIQTEGGDLFCDEIELDGEEYKIYLHAQLIGIFSIKDHYIIKK